MKSEVIISTFIATLKVFVQSSKIPAEQLYREFYNDEMLECAYSLNSFKTENCDLEKPIIKKIAVDYLCRYSILSRSKFGQHRPILNNCYCCGYIYDYVEYGKICTAYCDSDVEPSTQQDAIINLPFNWGDDCPEAIFDKDHKKLDLNILEECRDLEEDGGVSVVQDSTTARYDTTPTTFQTSSERTKIKITTARTESLREENKITKPTTTASNVRDVINAEVNVINNNKLFFSKQKPKNSDKRPTLSQIIPVSQKSSQKLTTTTSTKGPVWPQ